MKRRNAHRRIELALAALLLFAVVVPTDRARAQQQESDVQQLLRGRMEALTVRGEARAGGAHLLARVALPRFYEARGFDPAWIDSGRPGPLLDELLRAIDSASKHGLDPFDYHRSALLDLMTRTSARRDPVLLADLDLLATDAFLVLGSHILHGRVNPETIEPEWLANRRNARMDSVLVSAIDQRRVFAALADMAPPQARYGLMLSAVEGLRAIAAAGGWPTVPTGAKLEVGVNDARVSSLRARLRASGDLSQSDPRDPSFFDESLAEAVRRFQARHGLDADGVVGPATVAALNVPAAQRVRTLDLNLERWRWLPTDLGDRHIEVNIAGFSLDVVEQGRTVRSHRVVVGRQYRQTPMFSGRVTYLVLSPYWHVPPTIAAVDKLPLIKADRGYLAAQHMVLLDQATNAPVDVAAVPWESITGGEFNRRFRIRQDPGTWNALGQVKFMFPNRHNVYLHDTPSRELFGRTARGFSSGCIRVENPLDLAAYVLAGEPEWDIEAIRIAANQPKERTVRLSQPLPVHLLYWTAWADPDGTIHFRDDLYGRDDIVWRALTSDPPGA